MIRHDKRDNPSDQHWSAENMVDTGWSSNVLGLMISSQLTKRQGKAVTNFTGTLPADGAPKGSLFKRYPEGSGALFALVRPWFAVHDRGFRCAPGGRQGRLYGGD